MADAAEYEHYTRLRLLGRGPHSKVYLVKCQSDGSLFAIKQINISNMTDQEKKETLIEPKILEVLNHPNVTSFKEVYKTKKGQLNIVMEYIDDGDLEAKLKKDQYLMEAQILDWFTQICLGLKELHDRSIVHRNLKCENILLTQTDIIKLAGFGKARLLSKENPKDMEFSYHLAPEILDGKTHSLKSDIWSLGIILYNLCALNPPFEASSADLNPLGKIAKGEYPQLPGHFSKEIKTLVSKLLQVAPSNRPNINEILDMPIIKNRIKSLLDKAKMKKSEQMSNTIQIGIPEDYLCPITQEVMKHPVVAADGHTYERLAIIKWFESGHDTSPITREKLKDYGLINNYRLKAIIKGFQEQVPIMKQEYKEKVKREEVIEKQEKIIEEKNRENEELKRKLLQAEELLQQAAQQRNAQPKSQNVLINGKIKQNNKGKAVFKVEEKKDEGKGGGNSIVGKSGRKMSDQVKPGHKSPSKAPQKIEKISSSKEENKDQEEIEFNKSYGLRMLLTSVLGPDIFAKAHQVIKELLEKHKDLNEIEEKYGHNNQYQSVFPFMTKDLIDEYLPLLFTYAIMEDLDDDAN